MTGSASGRRTLLVSVFLLLILASASSQTAFFSPKTRQDDQTKETHSTREDFSNPMGTERKCNREDEGCISRRMVAEAYLDYIYTQMPHQS